MEDIPINLNLNTSDKILLSLFLKCSSVLEPDGNEHVIPSSEEKKDITTRELYNDLNFLFKSNEYKTISIKISGLGKQGYVIKSSPLYNQNLHYWRLTAKGHNKVLDPSMGILKMFMIKMIEILSREKSQIDNSSFEDDLLIIKDHIEKEKVKSNNKHIQYEKDKLRQLIRNKIKYGGYN